MSAIQGLLISIEVIMERPSGLSELSVISWVSAVVWWPSSALRRRVRSGNAVVPHFVRTMSALLP